MTCSQRSWVPKARTPRTWVTVLASQPSVSIETETTQRIGSPSWSGLPTVFMTSRSRSWSVSFAACCGSPVRSTISRRKRSISSAAIARKFSSSASPDSSCSLSISSVFGRGERVAVLVEVAEEREAAVLERRRAVLVRRGEAGDEVVDELRDRGVLADDDEAGRHADAALLPELERLLVVAVERLERGLELRRQAERVELAGLAAPLLRHLLADVLPEVAEHRHLVARDVVGDGNARQLDDAALDRVHEREVAHRPREERALGVAGAAEEERRRREVDDAGDAELAVHRLEPGDPDARGLVVLLGLLPLVALELFVVLRDRLLAVAVVRLVVEDEDVLHAHQVGHDALDHLAFGLQRVERRRRAPEAACARPTRARCARGA